MHTSLNPGRCSGRSDGLPDGCDLNQRYERAAELFQEGERVLENVIQPFEVPLKMVRNSVLVPHWINNSDCFWYEKQIVGGREYRLVDADQKTNSLAFNHTKFASELSTVLECDVDVLNLPISEVCLDLEPFRLSFVAAQKRWIYDGNEVEEYEASSCNANQSILGKLEASILNSPDGSYAVYLKDYNLWLRDNKSGNERPLTTDGEELYPYAACGSAWGYPMTLNIQARWSFDSKRIFTFQKDMRQVKDMPVMEYVPSDGSVRPRVNNYKIAWPGDDHVEEYRFVSIDIESGNVQEAQYRRVPVTRNSSGFFDVNLGWWHKDSRLAYFVDVDRYYKFARVVEFDTDTGTTRTLFEETSKTRVSLMVDDEAIPCLIPLPNTNELLWYSERSGWAHYYLYDLSTGDMKRVVTEGDWVVREPAGFDAERRELFLRTSGRDTDLDPYYCDLVRVNIDTGHMTVLAASDHEYVTGSRWEFVSGVSPTGNYAVVTRTRVDQPSVSYLLDRDGHKVMRLEEADISTLPKGWQWPEPVKLKAADGKTDIYGVVFRPRNFSPDKSYPILDYGMNIPETPTVPKGSFKYNYVSNIFAYEPYQLAELGFIVVWIDGRGTPFRNTEFRDASYGWEEGASCLEDHIVGIKQLADIYPYMDVNRVGIVTLNGGGTSGVQGLLHHPDFYSVGVHATVHDSRMMAGPMMGDMYEGPSRLANPFPEELASNLQGKLLLLHNMLDPATPVAASFRIINALQRANKDFEFVFEPKPLAMRGLSPYQVRRAWDFLVKNLLGEQPPQEFNLTK
ncbi:DPP IV N-terminal domain-containing protein [Paremcibacter congregatus]|uniref:S9 family peptidase n=1 Tax=Paremcibacter congregatus TaxID=2043170 RepID=UPI003A952B50